MNAQNRFYVELPPKIVLAEAKFELWVENVEHFEGITVEVVDDGGGAYLKFATESASLDPEELTALAETFTDVCKFIDENKKEKGEKQ